MPQIASYALISLLLAGSLAMNANAQSKSGSTKTSAPQSIENQKGQHDFDFSIGTWKTELSLLVHPLTDSTKWVEYEGISIVRNIWGGRANLVELEVEGKSGSIVGLSLRLYNPQSRQWSLIYSNVKTGTMSPPVIGQFKNGYGEFFGQETLNGRIVFVKFVISKIAQDKWKYEQSLSDDGGKNWEVNWIAIDTLVSKSDEKR